MLGKLYIIGGNETHLRGSTDVLVVSLASGEATAAAPMQAPRFDPTVASSASSIFVFGGRHHGDFLSSCEIFVVQSGW